MRIRIFSVSALLVLTCLFCKAQNITLWGMTYDGGADSLGVIFNYNVAANTYHVVHSFAGGSDGASPQGSLRKAGNGLLYGVTQAGGNNNSGVLFSYNMITSTYTRLHDFGGGTDGIYPRESLFQAGDGIIYGVASSGGINGNAGTLFSYNISDNTYATLYNFGDSTDGVSPVGALIQASDSLLYGCTSYGGTHGLGALYSYNISTHAVAYLHNFDLGGSYPTGSLVQANNGLLYGLTLTGGNESVGTIFSYNTTSNTYTDIHDFIDTVDGTNPVGSLMQASDGLLYGVTQYGGLHGGTQGTNGTFFSYDIATNAEVVIRDFGNNPDGAFPFGPLTEASNGTIYGATANGGVNGMGLIFAYSIAHRVYSALHNFDFHSEGANPYGGLLEADLLTAGEKQLSLTQLQISPNPSTGQFMVQLPGTQGNYPAEIYNMVGQRIQQITLSSTQNTIDLRDQSTGIYFVYLRTDNGSIVGKVIVER